MKGGVLLFLSAIIFMTNQQIAKPAAVPAHGPAVRRRPLRSADTDAAPASGACRLNHTRSDEARTYRRKDQFRAPSASGEAGTAADASRARRDPGPRRPRRPRDGFPAMRHRHTATGRRSATEVTYVLYGALLLVFS